jgi:hypothetical protein
VDGRESVAVVRGKETAEARAGLLALFDESV